VAASNRQYWLSGQ